MTADATRDSAVSRLASLPFAGLLVVLSCAGAPPGGPAGSGPQATARAKSSEAAPARPTTRTCAEGCKVGEVCVVPCCNGPCTPAAPFCAQVEETCAGKPACDCAGSLCRSAVPGVTCTTVAEKAHCMCPRDPTPPPPPAAGATLTPVTADRALAIARACVLGPPFNGRGVCGSRLRLAEARAEPLRLGSSTAVDQWYVEFSEESPCAKPSGAAVTIGPTGGCRRGPLD